MALNLDSKSSHDESIESCCSRYGVIQSRAGPRSRDATKPAFEASFGKRSGETEKCSLTLLMNWRNI